MATVYIIYSKSIDKFYIGSCKDFSVRLEQHNNHVFNKSFTLRAIDWEIFFKIDNLDYTIARKVEAHFKKMKSRKYILNLVKYPELSEKVVSKYKNSAGSFR